MACTSPTCALTASYASCLSWQRWKAESAQHVALTEPKGQLAGSHTFAGGVEDRAAAELLGVDGNGDARGGVGCAVELNPEPESGSSVVISMDVVAALGVEGGMLGTHVPLWHVISWPEPVQAGLAGSQVVHISPSDLLAQGLSLAGGAAVLVVMTAGASDVVVVSMRVADVVVVVRGVGAASFLQYTQFLVGYRALRALPRQASFT